MELKTLADYVLYLRTDPDIVQKGNHVLHNPARLLTLDEINTKEFQEIVDIMVTRMRRAPGVGLAAPQLGIPLSIFVAEDIEKYLEYLRPEQRREYDREPFDLGIYVNPELKYLGERMETLFEGCLSLNGYAALVPRHSEVEISNLDRFGKLQVERFKGFRARILQHEFRHLQGSLYDEIKSSRLLTNEEYRELVNKPIPEVIEILNRSSP